MANGSAGGENFYLIFPGGGLMMREGSVEVHELRTPAQPFPGCEIPMSNPG